MIITIVPIRSDQKEPPIHLFAVEGESQSRSFQFIISSPTGEILTLQNSVVSFYIEKPDGNLVMLPAEIESGKATVTLTLQACSVPGVAKCWLQIVESSGNELRIDNMRLCIQPCDLTGATESTPEFSALQEALGDVAAYKGHITDYNNPHKVNGNQIRTGVIRGETTNGPYFDLDANGGSGDLAASKLINDADDTVIAEIENSDTYSSLGFSSSDARLNIGLEKSPSSDFTLAHKADIASLGNMSIRANTVTSYAGGQNAIDMYADSTTNEGNITVYRGTVGKGNRDTILKSDNSATLLQYKANGILINGEKIEFRTGGYARSSIEDAGAYFSDIYTNGILLTPTQETWTPTLIAYAGSTAPTVSYIYQNGAYYRIGDLVMLTFRVRGAVTSVGNGYAGVGGVPIPAYNTNMGYLPVTLGSCSKLVEGSSATTAHTAVMSMGQDPEIIIRDAAGNTALKYITSTTSSYFELSGTITYIAADSE